MIEVKRERDYWIIYYNGEFYCTCDNRREVDEEIMAIREGN